MRVTLHRTLWGTIEKVHINSDFTAISIRSLVNRTPTTNLNSITSKQRHRQCDQVTWIVEVRCTGMLTYFLLTARRTAHLHRRKFCIERERDFFPCTLHYFAIFLFTLASAVVTMLWLYAWECFVHSHSRWSGLFCILRERTVTPHSITTEKAPHHIGPLQLHNDSHINTPLVNRKTTTTVALCFMSIQKWINVSQTIKLPRA